MRKSSALLPASLTEKANGLLEKRDRFLIFCVILTTKDLNVNIIEKYISGEVVSETNIDIIVFEKRKILIRAIVDYIAGMTDGYALEEYEKLK